MTDMDITKVNPHNAIQKVSFALCGSSGKWAVSNRHMKCYMVLRAHAHARAHTHTQIY